MAPVAVSEELYAFLDWCAETVYPQTQGATNVAAGAVLSLWHDARESEAPAPPDTTTLQQALEHISMDNLQLDSTAHTVFFTDPAMSLDVGAVGKGYAVELAAEAAEATGSGQCPFEHRRQPAGHREEGQQRRQLDSGGGKSLGQ